jgi:hypothetical protein
MSYCRDLKFEEKPDYNHLRRTFKDLFNKRGYEYDYVYDWNLLEKKNERAKRRANAAASGVSQVGILPGSRPYTGRAEGAQGGAGIGMGASAYQSQVLGLGPSQVYP